LETWTADGSKLPFTLAELATTCHAEDGGLLLTAILGDGFAKCFPGGSAPQTVVPKQVATLTATALRRLSEKFQAPAAKAKADASFADIAAKRARVG
jgi:hypothetical protein